MFVQNICMNFSFESREHTQLWRLDSQTWIIPRDSVQFCIVNNNFNSHSKAILCWRSIVTACWILSSWTNFYLWKYCNCCHHVYVRCRFDGKKQPTQLKSNLILQWNDTHILRMWCVIRLNLCCNMKFVAKFNLKKFSDLLCWCWLYVV